MTRFKIGYETNITAALAVDREFVYTGPYIGPYGAFIGPDIGPYKRAL